MTGYRGVLQDWAEALKWTRRAALQGHAVAQTHLGYLYRGGRGVPQNYAESVKWFCHAAESDVAECLALKRRWNVVEVA